MVQVIPLSGKTLAFTRVEVKDESGKLVAFGSSCQAGKISHNLMYNMQATQSTLGK
jgi:hypothetical protein